MFKFSYYSLSPFPTLTSLNTVTVLYRTNNERYRHQRCPPAQPQKYQRHDPSAPDHSFNSSSRPIEVKSAYIVLATNGRAAFGGIPSSVRTRAARTCGSGVPGSSDADFFTAA